MIWAGFFSGILVIQYILLLILLKANWKNYFVQKSKKPKVTVLIAARNEEKYIPRLLRSLELLDYPAELLEILIADDQSEDKTAQIASDWVRLSDNRKLITIRPDQGNTKQLNGKANALAIMSEQASGAFYFFYRCRLRSAQRLDQRRNQLFR
ncbi:glycosyltransferase [Algoriphagus boritolerans]|uniref:glycosyltransferase n=1 Tax=Algoriphagus boritolerans TaxID=308111 RepID=UPI000A6EB108